MSKNIKPLYTMVDEETDAEIRRRITKDRRMNQVIIEAIAATKANYPATILEVSFDGDTPKKKTKPKVKAKSASKKPRTAKQIGRALAKLNKPKAKKKATKKPAKKKSKAPAAKAAK